MSDQAPRITFDANVLFYAVDERDPQKHDRCGNLLRAAMQARVGFLTLQALGEFAYAVVRKNVLTRPQAAQVAKDWATAFEVVSANAEAFDMALDWWAEERQSYWDALLLATAARAGATACVSEDFSDGTITAGVETINPFAADYAKRLSAHGFSI